MVYCDAVRSAILATAWLLVKDRILPRSDSHSKNATAIVECGVYVHERLCECGLDQCHLVFAHHEATDL